ncbi:MAG: hypothetical protein JWM59_3599 [Verrucomicrobiales bacterium]|nr:hypothetical protein [Verrucomicrobiales bacterium]
MTDPENLESTEPMELRFTEPSETHPEKYREAAAAARTATASAELEPPAAPPDEPEDEQSLDSRYYYDSERKEYLVKNRRGVWQALSESQFKRLLRSEGFCTRAYGGSLISPVDKVILSIQNHHDIQYAGRLCGRKEGFYTFGQKRLLVTESFILPEPSNGDWPMLNAVISGLLGSDPLHGKTQVEVFHGWMKLAQAALRAERIQPAQAIAFAGPAKCGKSLLQSLITDMLGGRAAKPYLFMTGATPFNGELFTAEHLMMEDEFMSRRISDRLKLGASLKNFCVSTRTQSCHCKNRQAITLPAWWRVSISLNDDPEALLVLPPLDDHIADKLILLKATPFTFPCPMGNADDQDKFMNECRREIPGYLHWLLHEYAIPEELAEPQRYGVVSWHHPEIADALNNLSPEADLLALVDESLWHSGQKSWRGTSEELQRLLLQDGSTASQARKLLDWRNACGTYLGRLAAKPEPRVEIARSATRRDFIVHAPPAA